MARGGARPGAGRRPKSGRLKSSGRCLYVAQDPADASACKIGVAVDPYKSLANLKCRNSRGLKLVHLFRASSNSDALLILAKASLGPASADRIEQTGKVVQLSVLLQHDHSEVALDIHPTQPLDGDKRSEDLVRQELGRLREALDRILQTPGAISRLGSDPN
jgi:hypothetical protein